MCSVDSPRPLWDVGSERNYPEAEPQPQFTLYAQKHRLCGANRFILNVKALIAKDFKNPQHFFRCHLARFARNRDIFGIEALFSAFDANFTSDLYQIQRFCTFFTPESISLFFTACKPRIRTASAFYEVLPFLLRDNLRWIFSYI
jgi:hypothetical protein